MTNVAAKPGLCVAALALLLVVPRCLAAGRAGRVEFSDGEVLEGSISLAPGRKLGIFVDRNMVNLDLNMIDELRFAPEKEEMERQWRFVEVGQTEKEFTGKPYPTRHVTAIARLAGGKSLSGHLFTTVLYVEGESTKKVVLRAKQRGQKGQSFLDLVYPVHIVFEETVDPSDTETILLVEQPDPTGSQAVALTRGALVRLAAKPNGENTGFVFPPLFGAELFLSVRHAQTIWVGWPVEAEEETRQLIQKAMADVRDFFDQAELLAVHKDPASGDIYTLVMLRRFGKTTLHKENSQPWRLGLWRWCEADGKVMVAGRGHFFRGIVSRGEIGKDGDGLPNVRLSPTLWKAEPGAGDPVTLETP